jgi:glycosyltransferase involved in cell wall biosynthesis
MTEMRKPDPDTLQGLPRVVVVQPALAGYRVDLFNRLAQRFDFEVVFLRPQISYHKDVRQSALRASLQCRFSDLPHNWVWFNRDVPAGLLALVDRLRPDVVVTGEFSLATTAVASMRWRHPATGHVIWSDENNATLNGHNSIRHALRRSLGRRADALILCSRPVADAFARRYGIDRDRISVCGVHQEPASVRARLAAARETAEEMIGQHDLGGRRLVVFVGRLAPEKNLPLALQAFSRVLSRQADTRLVLVGSGPEREQLGRLAEHLGISARVIFAGHCEGDRLFAWYRMASVLVLPSTYEPYGAVVNEALICGVPVLCSDRAGAAHLIRSGINGQLFSPDAPDELAIALESARPWLCDAAEVASCDRPDLMPLSFDEDVEGYAQAVNLALEQRARNRGRPAKRVGPAT